MSKTVSLFQTFFLYCIPISLLVTSIGLAAGSKELDCMVKPEMYIELSSPVDGVLESLLVENSANVKKGQILATLESSIESARVKLAQQQALVDHTVDTKKVELAFSERNKTRYKDMYAKESTAFYDADRANTDAALAKLSLDKTLADKKAAELQLQLALAQLEQKSIKSPITGVVIERYVMPGESVNGRAIMKLAQVNPLRVELVAPAELFGQIRKGMSAEIKPEKPANQSYRATVTSVDQLIDPASGSFKVRLALPNPDDKLVAGVNCTAKLVLDQSKNAVKVDELPVEQHEAVNEIVQSKPSVATIADTSNRVKVDSNLTSLHQPASEQTPIATSQCMSMPTSTQLGLVNSDNLPAQIGLMAANPACIALGLFNCPEESQQPELQPVVDTPIMAVSLNGAEAVTGYMVFYPATGTYTQSKANFATLKKVAGKSIRFFDKGPLRGGISLGYSTDEMAAQKLAQRFIDKGFEVQIRPQHKQAAQHFAGLASGQAQPL